MNSQTTHPSCGLNGTSFVFFTRIVFVTASNQIGLDTRSMARRSIIVGILERGRLDMSRGSNPAGLYRSSTHLVQCGPDEPSWSWTQFWVQVRLPDCSLNWTPRYKGEKGVKVAAQPTGVGGLSASNLPLISIRDPTVMPDGPAKVK